MLGKTEIRKQVDVHIAVIRQKILVGFNDFESWCKNNHKEELLEEWDREANNILPTEVSYGSSKQIWWKCKKIISGKQQ